MALASHSWPVLSLIGSFVLLGACACEEEVQEATAELTFSPEAVDFGGVSVGTNSEDRVVSLLSSGSIPLRIEAVYIQEDEQRLFEVRKAPRTGSSLSPGEQANVEVGFSPVEEGSLSAVLVLETNEPESPARVALSGEALLPTIQLCHGDVDPDSSSLECEEPGAPLELDFGRVGKGEAGSKKALVRNVGRGRLVVEVPSFDEQASDVGFSLSESVERTSIPQGGGLLLEILFSGEGQGAVSGSLTLQSNDPAHPTTHIELVAEGRPNTPPVACAGVTRIVGIDGRVQEMSGPASEVDARPRDRLFLTAHPTEDCSYDAEDGTSLEYLWSVVQEPDGESAHLSNPESGPSPDAAPAQQPPMLDIAGVGEYRVELLVFDSLGAASTPAEIVIDATPRDDLIVELSWEVGADLDLHLIAPGASPLEERVFCDPLDCFWATCRPITPGVPVLHWGEVDGAIGDDGDQDSDPILRFDNLGDTVQRGTESKRIEVLSLRRAPMVDDALGPYFIGVGYFDSRGVDESFEAHVTAVSQGEILFQSRRTFHAEDEQTFWVVGSYDSASGSGEALDDYVLEPMTFTGEPGDCD